jgi:hypothetical protein
MRMGAIASLATLGGVLVPSLASAALVATAGIWQLQPNTPNQTIEIHIAGEGNDVQGAIVLVEIAGAGTLPTITGGSLVSGTIFASNHVGETYDFSSPHVAYLDVVTASEFVDGNGVLATLVIDTSGVSAGSNFDLKLTETAFGDSMVQTLTTTVSYEDGVLQVVPEPLSVGLLGLGASALMLRRRRV